MLPVPRLTAVLILLHLGPVLVAWLAGWIPGLLAMAALHLVLLGTTLWPGSTPFCPAVRHFPTTGRTVILTIDDGPCQDTSAVLDLLDRYSAKAVFFLIGRRAEADPAAVQAIAGRGHAVENHTLTHPAWTFWAYGPARQRREIAETSALLARLTGRPPRWFRAPAGFRNPFTGAVLRGASLGYMGWTARGFDTRETNPDKILVRLRRGFRPGAVLLIHQGHPHSLAVLETLLTALQAAGFRCVLPPAG
jgi:peptidoglycan/xylan/chitin deacetylase (PgdA/CDA1 family)